MFPFTNTAKEPGMLSSLPWRYLHFTTSSKNHSTSLKKGKYGAAGECFTTAFMEGAKMKAFFQFTFWNIALISFCPLSPKWDSIPSLSSTDSLVLITCHLARGVHIYLLLGHQWWSTMWSMNHLEVSPSIFQIKLIFNLAQGTVSPLATVSQTKHSEDQTWHSWLRKYP